MNHPLIDPIVEYVIKPKVMEGHHVEVLDASVKPPHWEVGTVTAVIAALRPEETILMYRVVLDRRYLRSSGRRLSKPIVITVTDPSHIRLEGEE